ncbi:protein CHUP1, chloroplastic-like [Primulina tabacum]|uniref:protein CHUP1, chloroplastic-like n=1 Tax=Primulina tabacum TaxID=48773 RepID=UPI003F592210
MVARGKREIPLRPVALNFGVALAISLGVILYTYFKTKRMKPPKPKPSQISPDCGTRNDSRREYVVLRDDIHAMQDLSPSKVSSPNSFSNASPSSRNSGERDGYLLPEFNELVKECNMTVTRDNTSPRKSGESLVSNVESPRECRSAEHEDQIREIRGLRSKVKILEERERILEIQLLEYYGLKEQETAVMELQNQIRLNDMEAKIYDLKIESLRSDKRRLEAQVADYARVVTELEAAKAKVKILRRKLRSDAEQNREQILILQERVMKLQDHEKKAVETDRDVELQIHKHKELETALEETKKAYQDLKIENSELAEKLEYVQMLATSALDNEEVQVIKEESGRLRQQNEDLTKEIGQLQADRCTDVEELVYLRWINACLRHELRNFQPGHGKTLARDLSKTLSPKSEEKAKQLILEYANKESSMDKGPNTMDFDSDQWSSSQASYLTDSGEPDDSSIDTLSTKKTNPPSKTRIFAKLMRLLRGKDSSRHQAPLKRTVSVDDTSGRYSSDTQPEIQADSATDGIMTNFITSSGESSRRSFYLQRSYSRGQKSITRESSSCSRRNSDASSLSIFRRIDSVSEDVNDSSSSNHQPTQDAQTAEKSELIKYAEALKNSRTKSSFRRRSSSFSSLISYT